MNQVERLFGDLDTPVKIETVSEIITDNGPGFSITSLEETNTRTNLRRTSHENFHGKGCKRRPTGDAPDVELNLWHYPMFQSLRRKRSPILKRLEHLVKHPRNLMPKGKLLEIGYVSWRGHQGRQLSRPSDQFLPVQGVIPSKRRWFGPTGLPGPIEMDIWEYPCYRWNCGFLDVKIWSRSDGAEC